MTPRILAIAGSDSSGGAGIQADIKTITMLGGYAMTAITAVTAQNTKGVRRIDALPIEGVTAQIAACVDDIGVDAIKTGMLGDSLLIDAIATAVTDCGVPLIVDPVLVASSGDRLVADEAVATLLRSLLPLATVITPNLPELEVLSGRRIADENAMLAAAVDCSKEWNVAVLAKGGHLGGERVTDFVVMPDGTSRRFGGSRIDTNHTHGTGCTLASALATHIARDMHLFDAVEAARTYVRSAIQAAPGFGGGHGPLGHWWPLTR
ncbi:bifunctional hydroxymethylpyrimidine kinase/phosphomethylpyrimidine kinase [Pacificimonas sp. ICDLI1SI03]